MRHFIASLLCAASLLPSLGQAGDAAPPPPDGYRMSHYRAPTPEQLPGAQRIDAITLAARLQQDTLWLIDVMPANRIDDADGVSRWLPAQPRRNLAGSVWLPNVGQGAPEAGVEAWFASELARLSAGNLDTPMVFYCLRDCWMSWNAGKRALALGYRQVLWFADGTDGWRDAGLALVDATPQPYRLPR